MILLEGDNIVMLQSFRSRLHLKCFSSHATAGRQRLLNVTQWAGGDGDGENKEERERDGAKTVAPSVYQDSLPTSICPVQFLPDLSAGKTALQITVPQSQCYQDLIS
ncbi:hypothetical protein SKAU_G00176350 [Synaphobranchus kaupii]|uniref:Uncharacterized protein n=1 Tax=Synaphobranchus kaupii TaxID=118154 RepID=A0A9Q1J189_SYNKA|nr:hypothetical protein SKAU_G00176350 [Synaphobranchus kaupii]